METKTLKARGVALVVALLATMVTAAWAQNGPNQNPAPASTDSTVSPPSANRPAAVDTATYEIGAQDLIFVDVWKHEEFTRQHRVRPDGKITIPIIGDMQAAGLTPERLDVQLTQALADQIVMPEVTVSVLEVVSKSYTMAGAVAKPGTYPMPVPIRIFDAINRAGGFAPNSFANKKEIVVIREGSSTRPVFNYEDFVKGKNVDKNVNLLLQNGDTVLVKE